MYSKYNINLRDIGKIDMGLLQVATADVVATTSFMLVFIAADPHVTQILRQEIQSAIVDWTGQHGKRTITIDVSALEILYPRLATATERRNVSWFLKLALGVLWRIRWFRTASVTTFSKPVQLSRFLLA
jgi:hypothetical protein